jgi:hypothetical protein
MLAAWRTAVRVIMLAAWAENRKQFRSAQFQKL